MTNAKQIALDIIHDLPETASWLDIINVLSVQPSFSPLKDDEDLLLGKDEGHIKNKLQIVKMFIEEIDASLKSHQFSSSKVYETYTPYNTYGASQILMNKLNTTCED